MFYVLSLGKLIHFYFSYFDQTVMFPVFIPFHIALCLTESTSGNKNVYKKKRIQKNMCIWSLMDMFIFRFGTSVPFLFILNLWFRTAITQTWLSVINVIYSVNNRNIRKFQSNFGFFVKWGNTAHRFNTNSLIKIHICKC